MQAIITKYLPATNTKPTRVKAQCSRGTIILSWSELEDSIPQALREKTAMTTEQLVHNRAATMLSLEFADQDRKLYGTPVSENVWMRPAVSGCLPDGSWAHVFTT